MHGDAGCTASALFLRPRFLIGLRLPDFHPPRPSLWRFRILSYKFLKCEQLLRQAPIRGQLQLSKVGENLLAERSENGAAGTTGSPDLYKRIIEHLIEN